MNDNDWEPVTIEHVTPKLQLLEAALDMFKKTDPQSVRVFLIVNQDRRKIYAPYVMGAKFDVENLIAVFTCAPLEVEQPLNIYGIGAIYTPRETPLKCEPYSFFAEPGDTINLTYTYKVEGP